MRPFAVRLIFTLFAFGSGLSAAPTAATPGRVGAAQAEKMPARAAHAQQGGERVPLDRHPNRTEILVVLKDLAARFGKARLNTFHVSPTKREGEAEFVYVYWKQDNSIITLSLPIEKPLEEESAFWLYTGKARIDLLKDVAPTESEVGSSTYLVAKPWVDTVIKDCVSNGQRVDIPKPPAKRRARRRAA